MCVPPAPHRRRQVLDRRSLMKEASLVDDMYDTLAVYEAVVPPMDQVRHDDLREAIVAHETQLLAGKEFIADFKADQVRARQYMLRVFM